jgi:hypothetical protein
VVDFLFKNLIVFDFVSLKSGKVRKFTYTLNKALHSNGLTGCFFHKVFNMSDTLLPSTPKKKKKPINLLLNIKIIFPSSIQGFGQQVVILENYLTTALTQNPNFSGEIKNVAH